MGRRVEIFELLSEIDRPVVRLRFAGLFQGRTVRWNATLMTLQACYEQWLEEGRQSGRDGSESLALQNFIDIGAAGDQQRDLVVGLDVPVIDRSTIEKCIIMVRQYRRLQPGRHDYGPVRLFPANAGAGR